MSGSVNLLNLSDLSLTETSGVRDSDWTYKSKEPDKYGELLQQKKQIEKCVAEINKNRDKLFQKLKSFQTIEDELLVNIPTIDDELYKNPKCLPADQLIIFVERGDAIMGIKAISTYWTDNWTYGYYEDSNTITELGKLSQGFKWLSVLPFYRFWSQIIYIKNTLKAIKSFIYQKNLYLYSLNNDSKQYNNLYREIYHNVYQIILRLVQTEVSPTEKLSLKTHKQVLKQKKIFTHDLILPICRLYGNIINTKVLLHQLFALDDNLSTNGLATLAIECKNVLPLLSNLFKTLPTVIQKNPENTYLAFLILLNFSEDVCSIKILLDNYPPFGFIIEYLEFGKQLLNYVGYQLFEVGKILSKISVSYNKIVNHSYLWEKYSKISKDVVDVYRVLINQSINDLLSISNKRDSYTENEIKDRMKRYVDLLEQIFLCNFYGIQYVKCYNVVEDNAKILKAFPTLSSSNRSVLMAFEKISEELRKECFHNGINNIVDEEPGDCSKIGIKSSINLDVSKLYVEEYDNQWKGLAIKAIKDELKNFSSKSDTFQSEVRTNDSTQIIEKLMTKGFFTNEIHALKKLSMNTDSTSESLLRPFESPSDISQSILSRLKKIRKEFSDEPIKVKPKTPPMEPEESEFSPRRLLETKFEIILDKFKQYKVGNMKDTSDLTTVTKKPKPSAESSVSSNSDYKDDTGAIQRAISESLKNVRDLSPTDNIVLESLITEVKDILPHLGEGFIKKCLEFYDRKTDVTIGAILEDRLDASLRKLDQTMPIIPPEKIEIPKRTVFEGDIIEQMAVFDPSRVFRKKNKLGFKNASTFLDDKAHIRSNADRYQKLSMDYYNDDYDDEYDVEPDLEPKHEYSDEEGLSKPLNKRLTKKVAQNTVSDESDSDSSDEKPVNNTIDFCQDPAALRARAEERRNSRGGHRGGGRGGQQRDVVGNPKGQGQDKSVLINRSKKNENKSRGANHNRRSGAAWKRNRGMIPS